jgi:hypothetical protein
MTGSTTKQSMSPAEWIASQTLAMTHLTQWSG